VVEEVGRTVLVGLDAPGSLDTALDELVAQATESVRAQCSPSATLVVERSLDLRYAGQEHALPIALGEGTLDAAALAERFGEAHAAAYGHRLPNAVQVLACRAKVGALLDKPELARLEAGDGDASAARLGERPAWDFATREMVPFSVYARSRLRAGDRLAGPAIVDEGNTVSVLQSDQQLHVDDFGHLVIGVRP
jgi:N-methylhydantoinase A